jgi:hypothetical protein
MTKSVRHLSWENFESTVLVLGQQGVHRISDDPRIEVFADALAMRIGIWLQLPADATLPPELGSLASVSVRITQREGRAFVETTTSHRGLFRQFYHFAIAVSERVLDEGQDAITAISTEIQCFSELLELKPLLGIERQLGLLGELVFLRRLIAAVGPHALNAWIGPTGEPHDFRIGRREFEVKTTTSPRRIHTIHGVAQLVPSADCSLHLVSLLAGPAGADAGFSLPDLVTELAQTFAYSDRVGQFWRLLGACGYRAEDEQHYPRRFALRRPIAFVPVDHTCPALTTTSLQGMLGPLAVRVESVQYDVNLEGLELDDDTAASGGVLPTREEQL